MSYEQALKHSKNHRKDRFVQQCSGYGGDGVSSHLTPTAEQEDEESKRSMTRLLIEPHVYPIFVHQTPWGMWHLVPNNYLFGVQIDSFEELLQFADDYAGVRIEEAIEDVHA